MFIFISSKFHIIDFRFFFISDTSIYHNKAIQKHSFKYICYIQYTAF